MQKERLKMGLTLLIRFKSFLTLTFILILTSCSSKNWKDASRVSANLAPKASELTESIVLIYYARAYSWRGTFAVHPWIAWKSKDEKQYTVAQVTSWNLRSQKSSIRVERDLPDRLWFDSTPSLLFETRGEKADKIIPQVKNLIKKYPFKDRYTLWPGPNSNTFISYLVRNIEELDTELPPHAIGKDYLGQSKFASKTASNSGFILSAWGLFGLTLGVQEGIELNILGLNLGLDIYYPGIKLPFIGRLGIPEPKKK